MILWCIVGVIPVKNQHNISLSKAMFNKWFKFHDEITKSTCIWCPRYCPMQSWKSNVINNSGLFSKGSPRHIYAQVIIECRLCGHSHHACGIKQGREPVPCVIPLFPWNFDLKIHYFGDSRSISTTLQHVSTVNTPKGEIAYLRCVVKWYPTKNVSTAVICNNHVHPKWVWNR